MKVSTNLVVATVFVAWSISANAKRESASVFASESLDDYTEDLSLSPSSSGFTGKESEEESSKLLDTADAMGEPPEDLYDFSSPSCSSDAGETSSASTTESNADTELTDTEGEGLTGEQFGDDSSTPLYDFSSPSCSSDAKDTDATNESNADTEGEGLTGEQSENDSSTPLYDFSSPSCSSDSEQTGSFTNEEKAIWIERHNFFRVAALPWAAGNMKRINWDDELAKEAASAAESCTAEAAPGLNVFKTKSADASSLIDEALNDWVVKPALSNIGSVVAPAKEGDPVGAGLYNSYTQVIWASTTSVGCAMADCSGESMVVCKYSPAGNDGKSPWFIHAAQATQCPTGTTAVLGLCVVEGDPANELIAPIPKEKSSLEVYPTFIADIMATILKAAKARDAPGADPLTVVSPNESVSESSNEESGFDTEASSSLRADEETEAAGEGEGKEATSEDEGKEATSEDEGKEATSKDLSVSDSFTSMDAVPEEGKSLDFSKELGESSVMSSTSSSEPRGSVKPSSEYGGDNETLTKTAEQGDLTEQESYKLTSRAEPNLKASVMANTQSAIIPSNGGSSPAAIAGMIVAGVVAVAIVAVFISYRKNQQRQREIMHDCKVEII